MPDIFSEKKRSQIMSKIRSKETYAEKIVFRYLRKQKIYFQKHYNRVAGKPDIALPRKKKAVFIDGDFWHGRNLKKTLARVPKIYWRDKIEKNYNRDKRNRRKLKNNGWQILRVWESDIKRKRTRQKELDKIVEFLSR